MKMANQLPFVTFQTRDSCIKILISWGKPMALFTCFFLKVVVNTECQMHEFSKNASWGQFQWNILPFLKFLPQRVWNLVTIIERKEMYGVSRQKNFFYISNHFAKCDHKGELSAVFSAIYYLKHSKWKHITLLNVNASHSWEVMLMNSQMCKRC